MVLPSRHFFPLLGILLVSAGVHSFLPSPKASSFAARKLTTYNGRISTDPKIFSTAAGTNKSRLGRTIIPTAKSTPYPGTALLAILDPTVLIPSDSNSLENIQSAFNVATFLPQPFWLLLIFLPNSKLTKTIMGGYEIITLFCLVHLFIVIASASQPNGTAPLAEFANVFDPSGNPQRAMVGMMTYPNFVSEEWSHVLTWDLFVGRWIWLDGLRRNIFTAHSVLLCNLIGPPGLLLHWATCLVTGKGIAPNEVPENENVE